MKTYFLPTAISLACLFACARSFIILDPFPNLVLVGQNYTLSWRASANYVSDHLRISRIYVRDYDELGNYNITSVNSTILGSEHTFDTLQPSFNWTAPSNLSEHGWYGFNLFGEIANGPNFQSAQANSDLFQVTFSGSPPPTSGTATPISTPTSASSSATSPAPNNSNSNHTSLAGGVIAAIVISVIVLIAFAIGIAVFARWRKRRSAFQKREAATRANRLSSVMPKGASASTYEMHGRSPQTMSKEINV